jgi:hypothetical protein
LAGAAVAVCEPTEHPLGDAPEVEVVRAVAARFAERAGTLVDEGRRLDDDGILEEALR